MTVLLYAGRGQDELRVRNGNVVLAYTQASIPSITPNCTVLYMILISRGIINRGQRSIQPLRYVAMEKDQLFIAVGTHIRTLRQAKGFSQEEFAAVAGLDRAYYGGIERGERNVSVRNLVRIAVTLGVEVGELFPPIQTLSALVASEQASSSDD